MSILLKTMDKMLSVMDKGVQQDVSRQLFEKFGGSLVIEPVAKASGKRKSKVPYWIREVTEVDRKLNGFAQLVGHWCKAADVGKNGSMYVIGIKKWAHVDGAQYATVRKGGSSTMGGVSIEGIEVCNEFTNFGAMVSYLE